MKLSEAPSAALRVDEIVSDPETEFEKAIALKRVGSILVLMSELVDAIQINSPPLYRALMRKVNKL